MPRRPIPEDSKLFDLIEQCQDAGLDPRAAEHEILRRCMRRLHGNMCQMAEYFRVEHYWLKRHIKYEGLWAEVEAARAEKGDA